MERKLSLLDAYSKFTKRIGGLNMYEIYISIILFLIGAFTMFIYIAISASLKEEKSNKVHFYVARDKDKILCLYLEKPIKDEDCGIYLPCKKGNIITDISRFKDFNLNPNDFINLSFDDNPVEVFLNLEN